MMGLEMLYRKPNPPKPAPGHKIYPYLLRKLTVMRPNQVWAMDITYIPRFGRFGCAKSPAGQCMARGFVYLVAVLDQFSRKVLACWLSNALDASFCVETLKEAIAKKTASPKL